MSGPGEHALTGDGDPALMPEAEPKKKKSTAARAKVRKHLLTTAFTNDVTKKLDTLHAAGHVLVAVVRSPDVRGFDIISYSEE